MGASPLLTAKTLSPLAKPTGSPQGPGHGQRASPALDGGGLWQWRECSTWLEVTPSLSPRKAEVRHRHPLTPEQWEAPSQTSPRWVCHVWAGGCGVITQHEAHPFSDPSQLSVPAHISGPVWTAIWEGLSNLDKQLYGLNL